MAYHVGLIVAARLGFEPVAVQIKRESAESSFFEYPVLMDTVGLSALVGAATADDVLVCNPSFSDLQLGSVFPGRSLMYVQGVNTYRVIDGFFDHYVAVSRFVRDHLALHYGWDVPVIAPFVHGERIGPPASWDERPPGSILTLMKAHGDVLLTQIRRRLAERHPQLDVVVTTIDTMSHTALLAEMRRHRYFLALSPLEGHPLMPIEAMLSGCCIVGFHGGGGRDYMRDGVNALVAGYPRVDAVVAAIAQLLENPAQGRALAATGRVDAGRFTYDVFARAWSDYVDKSMDCPPHTSHV
jgi:hypothetical protein